MARYRINAPYPGSYVEGFGVLKSGEEYELPEKLILRDEDGKLTLLSPTCTHMVCTVRWNPAEKSWDCPCHGSRYDVEGEVLNGPAIKPLAKKQP